MDLTPSIVPKSDQLNADDLMAGPRTITITEVRKGTAEQPVNIVTEEYGAGRPYKPSKSMRRVLVSAWGAESSNYAGRRMTLFRNPTIRFGKDEVGGIQISHMSNIEQPLTVALTVTRGKREPFTVQPLPNVRSARDWLAELETAHGDPELIRALGFAARAGGADEDTLAKLTAAFHAAKDGA